MSQSHQSHHSLADWDFMPDHVHSLSPALFISPPTSLRSIGAPGSGVHLPVLSRLPELQALSSGQIDTYFRCVNFARNHGFVFRMQSDLGEWNFDWYYFARFTWLHWELWRVHHGIAVKMNEYAYTTLANTWYRRRVTWETSTDIATLGQLAVKAEQFEAGEWHNWPGIWYEPQNYYKCSAQNRCGLLLTRHADHPIHIDDTLIATVPQTNGWITR